MMLRQTGGMQLPAEEHTEPPEAGDEEGMLPGDSGGTWPSRRLDFRL